MKKDRRSGDTPIIFFNTLSGTKEPFKSITKGEVLIYTCGPTVYNYAHIGNLRSYIFSDIIHRLLEYNGLNVRHVINITDMGHLVSDADEGEDKMTKALKREGKPLSLASMKELGDFYTREFKKELKLLNIKSPSKMPKASEHVSEQIAYIKTLEEKGYTYATGDGIYFDTSKFGAYGALGNQGRKQNDQEKEYSRIGVNVEKRNSRDFALWKFNKKMGWESPFGMGFPGWHIECTAMSTRYLGKSFDIHTGGIDHIHIHHNNEIAQTEAATGKKFVNFWMHNSFITIEGKKVSKSFKNEILLRNIIDRGFSPLAYRYWLLTAHYRSSINFTWEALEGAQTALFRLHRHFVEKLRTTKRGTVLDSYQKRFLAFLNDDLDTPQALTLLFELMRDGGVSKQDARTTFLDFDRVLGLGFTETNKRLVENLSGKIRLTVDEAPEDVKKLLAKRDNARKSKNWQRADELREEIHRRGYNIEDSGEEAHLVKK
ncbi:cysteine--tRNA ligase [Patescibacteria group bacterium]|nr:cysteine--tRNA ligase [Patescibacteria group bacterium]